MASRGQAKLLTRAKRWQEISCATLPTRDLCENFAPSNAIPSASFPRATAASLSADDHRPKHSLTGHYARLSRLLLKNAPGSGSLLGPRVGCRSRDSSRDADISGPICSSMSGSTICATSRGRCIAELPAYRQSQLVPLGLFQKDAQSLCLDEPF